MKGFFRFMAGMTGRTLRGVLGFALMAWGYNSSMGAWSMWLLLLGTIILFLALFNIALLAPLFGFPIRGKKILMHYGVVLGIPGEDPTAPDPAIYNTALPPKDDQLVQAAGSTTQGGSNYGQGSLQLSGNAYKQGSEKNAGANYQNEARKFGDKNKDTLDQKPS